MSMYDDYYHSSLHVIACDFSKFVYTYMCICTVCMCAFKREHVNVSEPMDAHSDFVGMLIQYRSTANTLDIERSSFVCNLGTQLVYNWVEVV